VSLLVAIAVNSEGYREILGIVEGAKEDKAGWSGFLKHLKERGLNGVRLIISDACIGLAESAAEFFPDAAWQRCVVHFYRNVFSHVPRPKMREAAAMLKAIHAAEDVQAAREKAKPVTAQPKSKVRKILDITLRVPATAKRTGLTLERPFSPPYQRPSSKTQTVVGL
jgi:putative transposase